MEPKYELVIDSTRGLMFFPYDSIDDLDEGFRLVTTYPASHVEAVMTQVDGVVAREWRKE